MSTKSVAGVFLIPILILAICSASFADNIFDPQDQLLSNLILNLRKLQDEGILFGSTEFIETGIFGSLYFPDTLRPPAAPPSETLLITFKGDKILFDFKSLNWVSPVFMKMELELKPEQLSGSGNLYGDAIQADFELNTQKNAEGNFDLYLNFTLNQLLLTGILGNIQQEEIELIWVLNQWTRRLGFANLYLNIVGDKCIQYQSLEENLQGSVNLSAINTGERKGLIKLTKGRIWRFGQEFKLLKAEYDFSTNQVNAKFEYKTKIYISTEKAGTILQKYMVRMIYQGSTADKVDWRLECKPELSTDEIIALLVRGDPYSTEISNGVASNLEETVKSTMKKYSAQRFTNFAEKKVGKLLALDRVKIEGALFTLDNPYIAEKEISPRLKLNFRGTVSGMTEQKVSFDYLLGGNFFLTTETNQNGKTNFDLRYVIKFK